MSVQHHFKDIIPARHGGFISRLARQLIDLFSERYALGDYATFSVGAELKRHRFTAIELYGIGQRAVVSRIFRTLDQATAPVCMTCDWWRGRMFM